MLNNFCFHLYAQKSLFSTKIAMRFFGPQQPHRLSNNSAGLIQAGYKLGRYKLGRFNLGRVQTRLAYKLGRFNLGWRTNLPGRKIRRLVLCVLHITSTRPVSNSAGIQTCPGGKSAALQNVHYILHKRGRYKLCRFQTRLAAVHAMAYQLSREAYSRSCSTCIVYQDGYLENIK